MGCLAALSRFVLHLSEKGLPLYRLLRKSECFSWTPKAEEALAKLLAARFIREVFHSDWLANPVLVKKKTRKWRMCVDYTGLNKACLKDHFPLPRIDQIVDSTSGCEILSFLDAYSGYHQITMKESYQLTTSFITLYGLYCYITMPFGLKNAGATN